MRVLTLIVLHFGTGSRGMPALQPEPRGLMRDRYLMTILV